MLMVSPSYVTGTRLVLNAGAVIVNPISSAPLEAPVMNLAVTA